jgi:hypothetical protein
MDGQQQGCAGSGKDRVPKSISRSALAKAVQRSHTPIKRKMPSTNSAIVAAQARNGMEDAGMNEFTWAV